MVKRIYIWLCLLFISAAMLFAQDEVELRINQIIDDKFPNLEIFVSVADKENKPVLSLVKGQFKVFADGSLEDSKLEVQGFQYTDEGIEYKLLLSANGMMEGEAINSQKKAAIKLIESLREQDRISFYLFGEDVKAVTVNASKQDNIVDKIAKIETLGDSPRLYDALVSITRKSEEAEKSDEPEKDTLRRKVVIVMSDGRNSNSTYTRDQVLEIYAQENIPIYSLGFFVTTRNNLSTLDDLAEKTGGHYIYSGYYESFSVMENNIIKIKELAELGYTLKCKVKSVKPDDQLHQLQVKVTTPSGDSGSFKNFTAIVTPMGIWVKIVIAVVILIVIILLIILFLLSRKGHRKKIGIAKNKCPVCKRRMKDDWDECIFCKYLPPKKSLFGKAK